MEYPQLVCIFSYIVLFIYFNYSFLSVQWIIKLILSLFKYIQLVEVEKIKEELFE